jgi:hypothetical protein
MPTLVVFQLYHGVVLPPCYVNIRITYNYEAAYIRLLNVFDISWGSSIKANTHFFYFLKLRYCTNTNNNIQEYECLFIN